MRFLIIVLIGVMASIWLSGCTHTKGKAADIKTENSEHRYKIVEAALRMGCDRVGIAKTYVHLDIDKKKPRPRMWVY